MFVRWKRRERVSRKTPRRRGLPRDYFKPVVKRLGLFLLTAVLVRSERRDGRPRQKTLAYLGSIREDMMSVGRRRHFWERAEGRLDALNLEPAQRLRVEAALLAVVARPTAEEAEAAEREFRDAMRQIGERLARP